MDDETPHLLRVALFNCSTGQNDWLNGLGMLSSTRMFAGGERAQPGAGTAEADLAV